ncbi:hypothetical protein [Halomonas sp. M20]|uniref:hypothetical protein n=1 Tax=Halomonas sp. M20 TaxID=2763264 RepID=UPI001D0A6678|nr:hypothetical protein [Halomonas sp. M20]
MRELLMLCFAYAISLFMWLAVLSTVRMVGPLLQTSSTGQDGFPVRPAGTLHYAADVGHGLTENEVVRLFVATVASGERGRLRIAAAPQEVAEVR